MISKLPISDLPENPVATLAEAIATARSCGELGDLRRRLPHTRGILDPERARLLQQIRARENALLAFYLPAYSLKNL